MSYSTINEDLRSRKTKKALYGAMFSLLKGNSFRQITVKGICEEVLISRAAFYTHFIDKYDLLEHWLSEMWPKSFDTGETYEQLEAFVNNYTKENMLLLRNLVYDADYETFDILFNYIVSTINLTVKKNEETFAENVVLANFYAGGIISYLLWQIKHNFPEEVPTMNRHLYKMVHEFKEWNQNRCKVGGDFK